VRLVRRSAITTRDTSSAGEYKARRTKDGFVAQDLELAVGIGDTIEREVKLQSRQALERLAAEGLRPECFGLQEGEVGFSWLSELK
jgi:hypothetical protein